MPIEKACLYCRIKENLTSHHEPSKSYCKKHGIKPKRIMLCQLHHRAVHDIKHPEHLRVIRVLRHRVIQLNGNNHVNKK